MQNFNDVRRMSTHDAAQKLGIKAQTLRAALCREGSYFGCRPVKCSNRLLRWPADEIERLVLGLPLVGGQ